MDIAEILTYYLLGFHTRNCQQEIFQEYSYTMKELSIIHYSDQVTSTFQEPIRAQGIFKFSTDLFHILVHN